MAEFSTRLETYYRLTKPGIIYGNLVTASAGFLLASQDHLYFLLLFEVLAGMSLVIASACVFNNYIDRGIDQKMDRTSKRALVIGQISGHAALVYASLLGTAGFLILAFFTNWLVFGIGLISIFFYVVLYGLAKRHSVHGTLVGSVPGATPPVAGYLAVTDHLDGAAVILFLTLVLWQMPHFYAIAMYRYKDYKAAGLPVLPVKLGMKAAKRQIMAYIVAFTAVATLLTVFGYTGYIYLAAALALGIYWLWRGYSSYNVLSDERWGRRMFFSSLIVTLGISVAIALGALLP
ncbi:MAG: heme o synthase [Candidatus Saccharimonadales bacterium]